MKAVRRLGLGFAIVAASVAASLPVHAQTAPPEAEENSTVGPRGLENFSINGTVTQPAPAQRPATPPRQAPTPAPAPSTTTRTATPPATTTRQSPAPARTEPESSQAPARETPSVDRQPARPEAAEPARQTAPSSSVTVPLPPAVPSTADAEPAPIPDQPASGGGVPVWPWLLAALALAGGGAFLWWRKQQALEPAVAGGPADHAFAAPEPAPRPVPEPRAPAAAPLPAPRHDPVPDPFAGVVSTRLRPWVELAFEPSRCTVEDDKVTIEFEVEMMNSGNAPARAILVEAKMVNAGPAQEAEISQFFANPVGEGNRIPALDPLKSMRLKSRIVAPRQSVQVYEVGGRQVFVPLIAFNILYEWGRGHGQTSLSYLVGRDTKGDKMAPFRLDVGPRLFRQLGQQPLPMALRQ